VEKSEMVEVRRKRTVRQIGKETEREWRDRGGATRRFPEKSQNLGGLREERPNLKKLLRQPP